MNTFEKIRAAYTTDERDQRFGQYFCNTYISQPWPELFNASYSLSCYLIIQWLNDHQYVDTMPPLRKEN